MLLRSQGRHVARLGTSFNALWFGQTISLFGDFIAYSTVPLYVLEISDDTSGLTTIFALENIPTLLFGFLGGFLVDRWNRRTMAIVADIVRAAAFGVLAYLAHQGTLDIAALAIVAFLIGSMAASFNAALLSYVPALVPEHRLAMANTRLAMSQQIAFVTGPLVGVLILEVTDSFALAFMVNGATFIVSAISLVIARPKYRQARSGHASISSEVVNGLRQLWGDPVLRYTAIGAASANLGVGFLEPTLVFLGEQLLGLEEMSEFGLLFLGFSAGGVIGAVTAGWVIRRLDLGRTFVTGIAVFAIGITGVAGASDRNTVVLSLAVGLIGLPWLGVSLVTIRQLRSPDAMLGRITSASRAIAWGSLPIGAFGGGWLADNVFSFQSVLAVVPIILIATAVWLRFTPVWSMREKEPALVETQPA